MSDFENHFLQKLTELVPYEYDEVMIGCPGLNITYTCRGNTANPLDINLNQPFSNSLSASSTKLFYSAFPVTKHVFTKRIRKTPYYISYLIAGNLPVYILDFYVWKPVPVIYRIFSIQSSGSSGSFKFNFPTKPNSSTGKSQKVDNCFYNYHVQGQANILSNDLVINSEGNADSDTLLILAYSTEAKSVNRIQPSEVLTAYNKAESISRKNHIVNDLKVQDHHVMSKLDCLWSRFKLLTPEREPDIHINNLISKHQKYGFVIKQLCEIFGWDHLSEKITFNYSIHDKNDTDPGRASLDAIAAYYQSNSILNEMRLSTILQKWWDRYSLPLYELKFESLLKNYPEKIYIIYFLAQWMRLPWGRLMLDRCQQFSQIPELEILSYLTQLIQIKKITKNTIFVKSGMRHAGNFVQLNRGNNIIRITHYGKKTYSSILIDKSPVVRVDKRVSLQFDEENHNVEILPDLAGFNPDILHIDRTILKVDDYTLNTPLLWRKIEIHHKDLRLRWILKKGRFQISLLKKKIDANVEINGHKIEFVQSHWLKIYQAIRPISPQTGLMMFDGEGRSFFFTNKHPQECQVIGWLQDHNGILVNRYNLKIEKGRQWLLSGSESGYIDNRVMLTAGCGACRMGFKKYLAVIELQYLDNIELSKILLYSPTKSIGHFIAVTEDTIQDKNDIITAMFVKNLGFSPLVIAQKEFKNSDSGSPAVLISLENKGDVNLNEKSNLPIIRLGDDLEMLIGNISPL